MADLAKPARVEPRQRAVAVVAGLVLLCATAYLVLAVGVVALFLVGIPGALAYLMWWSTSSRHPIEPAVILPGFLLAMAGFALHCVEQFLGGYGPSIGRIFGFAWTEDTFVVIVLALLGGLGLVAVGLYHRIPIAGFIALVFLVTRLAEIALFVFPLLAPAIQPAVPGPVSVVVGDTLVTDMPNNYLPVVGRYYFPGMYTVILPVLPAAWALWRVWTHARSSRTTTHNHRTIS